MQTEIQHMEIYWGKSVTERTKGLGVVWGRKLRLRASGDRSGRWDWGWGQKEKKAYRGDQIWGEHPGEHRRDSAHGSRACTALQARLPTGEGEPDLWEGPTSLWADWPLELRFVQKEEGRESSRRRKPRVSPPRLQVGKGGKLANARKRSRRDSRGVRAPGALTRSCAGCPSCVTNCLPWQFDKRYQDPHISSSFLANNPSFHFRKSKNFIPN